jgi:uncharacterized membrane protein YesL
MSLISLIIILVVIGVLLYLINQYIPMDAKIKQVLNIVVIIAVVIWLLTVLLGANLGGIGNIRVGK